MWGFEAFTDPHSFDCWSGEQQRCHAQESFGDLTSVLSHDVPVPVPWKMGGTQSTYKASQMFGYKEMKEKPSHQFSFGSCQGPQIRRVQRVTAQNGSLRYSLVLEDFVCQQENLKVN